VRRPEVRCSLSSARKTGITPGTHRVKNNATRNDWIWTENFEKEPHRCIEIVNRENFGIENTCRIERIPVELREYP
jgi:hypothetical protein